MEAEEENLLALPGNGGNVCVRGSSSLLFFFFYFGQPKNSVVPSVGMLQNGCELFISIILTTTLDKIYNGTL